MAGEHGLAARLFDLLAGCVVAARHGEHVDPVAAAVHLLRQRYGHDGRVFDIAERHGRTLLAQHADHPKIGIVHLDHLACRVLFAREQVFRDLCADDADLAFLHHVHLVDETAVEDFLRVDLLVVGRVAHQRVVAFVFAVAAMHFVAPEYGRGVQHFGLFLDGLHVFVVHPPPAVLGHALVGNSRLFGLHEQRVGRHVAQLRPEQASETHAGAQHHREHEDAPEDPQRGHDAALAVPGDGLPDFVPTVCVEKGHGSL